MSNTPNGPGWWQARDGLFYPPERHPDAVGLTASKPAAGNTVDVGTDSVANTLSLIGWIVMGISLVTGVLGTIFSGYVEDRVVAVVLGAIGMVQGLMLVAISRVVHYTRATAVLVAKALK